MHGGEPGITTTITEPDPEVDEAAHRHHPRRRERIRWNLVGCAFHGHEVVGTDVAVISPADRDLVRPADEGRRWHRCLRCDAWLDHPVPVAPTRQVCPSEDEIEVPLRGRALRDRYVLKMIALERLLHVAFFSIVGVGLLFVARHRDVLDSDFRRIVSDAQVGGSVRGTGIEAEVGKLFSFSYTSLYLLAVVALAYAVFEGVEAGGLWLGRRWAEYLTFIATTLLLPLEVYGVVDRPSPLNVATFAINAAIVAYLLFSKGLFGIRPRGHHGAVGEAE